MDLRRALAAIAALSLVGCYPTLKAGSDRDATTDSPPPDRSPSDGPPPDAPTSAQRSCPPPSERGCGVVRIEAGTYSLGEPNPASALAATPVQPAISVSAFGMDSHEVTVARFRRFRASSAWSNPAGAMVYPGATLTVVASPSEPTFHSATPECNWTPSPGAVEEHPINCLDWPTAMAFCAWDGGRLPTEAEWEWVARGRPLPGLRAGRAYPWGDEPDPTCVRARWRGAMCAGEDGASTRRVGHHAPSPDSATAGLYDLAGNVFEWTADSFAEYSNGRCWGTQPGGRTDPVCVISGERAHSLRGGNWYLTEVIWLHSATRLNIDDAPGYPLYGVGVRCVRTR